MPLFLRWTLFHGRFRLRIMGLVGYETGNRHTIDMPRGQGWHAATRGTFSRRKPLRRSRPSGGSRGWLGLRPQCTVSWVAGVRGAVRVSSEVVSLLIRRRRGIRRKSLRRCIIRSMLEAHRVKVHLGTYVGAQRSRQWRRVERVGSGAFRALLALALTLGLTMARVALHTLGVRL